MKLFSKKQDDLFSFVDENENNSIHTGENTPAPTHALTAEEVLSSKTNTSTQFDSAGALDSLKKRMFKSAEKDGQTLLERCKPFITDEKGDDASVLTEPIYKLDSVEDILKSDGQKIIDQLAHKYDISVDYLGKYIEQKTAESPKQEKAVINKTEKPKNQEFEDKIQLDTNIKNVQSSVPFVISDIDDKSSVPEKDPVDLSSTATITFSPITDLQDTQSKIVVTTQTRAIDLTSELEHIDSAPDIIENNRTMLEKDEFDDFVPENEFKTEKDAKKLIRIFSIQKRRFFISSCFSVLITLILAFMKLPFMNDFILSKTFACMIFCASVTFMAVLLNCSMFINLPKIFSKKATADSTASLASLFVLAYAVLGIVNSKIILDLLLCLCVILSLRSIGKFRKKSYMLSNLKQIATSRDKKALRLISDPAVTFAMAKDFIEGDTLIAADQECKHIEDYMKYSTFGTFLNGKLPTISVLSLIISSICALASTIYFNNLADGFYAFAVIQCFACLPNIFFIDNLPIYSASKKLNKSESMISGKAASQSIENVNALVLNSTDLFPIGTVSLHQMQVLSDNNLDQTILRAASLTQTLNSPLAPIFKKIAGESNITVLPDSDTVKYEDRMGISGWVDDKLLFIGNRTLMEAHGISVPSIEVDRKILRGGYFPVYVASGDKACALLIVQYDVSPTVAKELRHLTKIGVTLLISNTDPNITKEMICDYLGLYDDSVMLMSAAGCHMYKCTLTKEESCSAPAAFKGSAISLAKIINCSDKIKKSNIILTILYIVTAILGIIIFAYASFNGSGTLIDGSIVLLYSLITTVISYILYLTQKP